MLNARDVPQSGLQSAKRFAVALAHTGAARGAGRHPIKPADDAPHFQADARAADACCVASEAALVELRAELRRTSVALDFSLADAEALRREVRRGASQPAGAQAAYRMSAGRLSDVEAPRRAPRSSSPSKRSSSARWSGACSAQLVPPRSAAAHATR